MPDEYNFYSFLRPEIENQLSSELSEETGTFSLQYLQELRLEIKLFLLEIDNIMIRFNNKFQIYSLSNDKNSTIEYKRWIVARNMIREQPEIEKTLKEGYGIIDKIRSAFTGEELKYYVGVIYGRGKNRKLYEGYLSMADILKMAKLEPIWKNTADSVFKLRLQSAKGSLVSQLQPANETHSTLWSSIANYASVNKFRNQGNLFEAYRVMKGQEGSNHIPPSSWTPELFDKIFPSILNSIIKNTISFAKGGDYLDESVKYFGNSNPSLASLSTIKNILEQFQNVISYTDLNLIKLGLKSLFEKSPIYDDIAFDAAEMADEEVQNLIKELRLV